MPESSADLKVWQLKMKFIYVYQDVVLYRAA